MKSYSEVMMESVNTSVTGMTNIIKTSYDNTLSHDLNTIDTIIRAVKQFGSSPDTIAIINKNIESLKGYKELLTTQMDEFKKSTNEYVPIEYINQPIYSDLDELLLTIITKLDEKIVSLENTFKNC